MVGGANGLRPGVLLLAWLGACAAPSARPAASADSAVAPQVVAPRLATSAGGDAVISSAVASPAAATTAAEPSALHYTIRVDAALSTIEVEVCFEGRAARDLTSGVPETAGALSSAWIVRGETREALPIGGAALALPVLPDGTCVGYALAVERLSGWRGGGMAAARSGDALLANVAGWLWRPERWDLVSRADARFELPAGTQVSVPWTQEGERYRVDPSAFAFYGGAVFGHFEQVELALPIGTLELAVLPGLPDGVRANLEPWLRTAAAAAAQVIGRLADDRVQVVVLPQGPSEQPVRFGMATRGGGSSLLLLVSSNAQLDPLRRDWIAIHELCHLLHPFVAREQAWLSEGLATYYQEVLRVRAGLMPAQDAWRRLYEGSLRGRAVSGSLAQASAMVMQDHDFPTIYWAGASFMLLADAELRAETGGKRTLDDVITGLHACCARQPRPLPAQLVLARMDELAGKPVFSQLAARWVDGPKLPDLDDLYARLGVRVEQGTVQLQKAPQAWIRDAIMASKDRRSDQ